MFKLRVAKPSGDPIRPPPFLVRPSRVRHATLQELRSIPADAERIHLTTL